MVRSVILSGVPPNKHQLRTEATRQKLLKSARRIFARDGFEAARIEDVAADAGHTRGAFYAHFQTKEELFLALLEQQANIHFERIRQLLESARSPEERLRRLREYYVACLRDREWTMLILEFKLFALRHGRLRARLAEAHRRIRDSLLFEQLEQYLPDNVQCKARGRELRHVALEAMLNGLALERMYDPKRLSEREANRILRLVFNTLVGNEEGARAGL